MRIHSEYDATYIAALASCLRSHAKSFEQWFLLFGVYPDIAPLEWQAVRRQKMREIERYFDGVPIDVFCTEQPGMILLSRDLNSQSLGNIARLLGLEVQVLCELGAQAPHILALLEKEIQDENSWFPMLPASLDGEAAACPLELSPLAVDMRTARIAPHVLLVEDDPIALRVAKRTIAEIGDAVIHVAPTAEAALAMYAEHVPDMVFMDIGLPASSGFEVLRSIMCSDSRAYVVMLSAHHEFDCLYRALYEGAKGYVAKPFRVEQLRYYYRDCMLQRRVE